MKCVDCEYENDGANATRAVSLHRMRMHDTTAIRLQYARYNFWALIEATGNWQNAAEAMDLLHHWPDEQRPPDETIRAWADDWEANREQGVAPNNFEGRVRAAAQRLRAVREYGAWKMLDSYTGAGVRVGDGIKNGEIFKNGQPKYLADGVSMMLRDIGSAFGTPKPTPTQIGNLIINAGERPQQLPRPSAVKDVIASAIDVEFTVDN